MGNPKRQLSIYIYIYIYTYIHTYIHTYLCIYIYIYTHLISFSCYPFSLTRFGATELQYDMPNRLPLLRKTCSRQVVSDKWLPLSIARCLYVGRTKNALVFLLPTTLNEPWPSLLGFSGSIFRPIFQHEDRSEDRDRPLLVNSARPLDAKIQVFSDPTLGKS